jgi:hypothetical protein
MRKRENMTDWSLREIQELTHLIYEKSKVDLTFRALCLADINTAVKQLSGKEIPSHFKIKVIEEEPEYDFTLMLPQIVGDLSDEKLEEVAGGTAQKPTNPHPGIPGPLF